MHAEKGRRGTDLVRSVFRNAVGNLAGPIGGLLSAPVLAQAVGVDGRGAVAAVSAPILLAAVIAGFGLPDAMTYFVARSPGVMRRIRRRVIVLAMATATATATVVALGAPVLLADPPSRELLAVLAASTIVPSAVIGVLRAHAAGLGRWGAISIERTAGPLLRLIAFLALSATHRLDVTTASIVMVAAPLVAGLIYLRDVRLPVPTAVSSAPAHRTLLDYGARAWFGTLAGAVVMRLDQVLMVPLSSSEQLGLYAVAVTISELPLVATSAVREVLLTSDARSEDDHALARAARLAAMASASAAAALCAGAPWWLPRLFGQDFAAAVPPMVILAAAVVIGVPGSIAGAALSARGLPHLRSISLLIAAVIGTTLVVVVVPTWGAVGGAAATFVCNVVGGWANVAHLVRRSSLTWADFLLPSRADARAAVGIVHKVFARRQLST